MSTTIEKVNLIPLASSKFTNFLHKTLTKEKGRIHHSTMVVDEASP